VKAKGLADDLTGQGRDAGPLLRAAPRELAYKELILLVNALGLRQDGVGLRQQRVELGGHRGGDGAVLQALQRRPAERPGPVVAPRGTQGPRAAEHGAPQEQRTQEIQHERSLRWVVHSRAAALATGER